MATPESATTPSVSLTSTGGEGLSSCGCHRFLPPPFLPEVDLPRLPPPLPPELKGEGGAGTRRTGLEERWLRGAVQLGEQALCLQTLHMCAHLHPGRLQPEAELYWSQMRLPDLL